MSVQSNRHRELPTKPSEPWPFPSVRYDYEAARVGTGHQVIEIDHEEVARVLAFFRSAPQ